MIIKLLHLINYDHGLVDMRVILSNEKAHDIVNNTGCTHMLTKISPSLLPICT